MRFTLTEYLQDPEKYLNEHGRSNLQKKLLIRVQKLEKRLGGTS